MIALDGSRLEGGGQILRTALALSGLTQQAFSITNIRHSRPSPGLKAQHLTAVNAAAEWCNAKVKGAELGSEKLTFSPNGLEVRTLTKDIGTAGSITLLLQALLPLALFGDRKVTVKLTGGTDVEWSPPIDYFIHVLLPHLRRFADIGCRVLRRGYYPKGGGEVEITVNPALSRMSCSSTPEFLEALNEKTGQIQLKERGQLLQVRGVSHASITLQKAQVAERQSEAARFYLSDIGVPAGISAEYQESLSAGSGITLWGVCGQENSPQFALGGSALGERGITSENVGKSAALSLKDELSSNAAVDCHLADQLVLFMGLLPGSELAVREVSQHCKTNCHTVQEFLPVRFVLKKTSIASTFKKSL